MALAPPQLLSDAPGPPRLISDEPELSNTTAWQGLWRFAERVSGVLPGLPASSPVLVTGDWGSGKTTLLRAVSRSLQNSGHPVIWFDAWRYEGERDLLPALIRQIWESTPESFRRSERHARLFRSLWVTALVLAGRVIPAAAQGMMAAAAAPAAGVVTGAIAAGKALAETSLDDVSKDVETIEKAASSSEETVPRDATKELWSRLAKLVEEAWPDQTPFVVIDDLDRCAPSGAIGLLDAMRLFVTSAPSLNCRFIVALDRTMIVQAISQKFGGAASYDSNRYLEKVFPISFSVPVPDTTDVAQLVQLFIGNSAVQSEGQDHVNAISIALSSPLFANPRLMKRCLNKYRLVLYFERSSPRAVVADFSANSRLASWIAASERWPTLRRAIHRGTDFWNDVRAAVKGEPHKGDVEIRGLLDQQGVLHWLGKGLEEGAEPFAKNFGAADVRLQRWGM